MIPDASGKPNPNESDPEKLQRLLELELVWKRAEWKQIGERYHAFRSMSFVFLFLLIAGALVAAFFVFSRVNEKRSNQRSPDSVDVAKP
ncbi:MAG TPA: hypothetical protein VGQ95_11440 [Chthoniobacterales bacterium]|nr:hypothetical protein [Chthoniobacterales bacterium]